MTRRAAPRVVIDQDCIEDQITDFRGYIATTWRRAVCAVEEQARRQPRRMLLWTFLAGVLAVLFLRRR